MTNARIATRKHLALISTNIDTRYEGEKYTPKNGTAYQDVFILNGFVQDLTFDGGKIGTHILQVTLHYESGVGVYDVEERVKEIVTHFKRGTKLTHGDTCVVINTTPQVKNMGVIDDREVRVISIKFNI